MKKRNVRAVLVLVLSFSVIVFAGIQRLEAQGTTVVYVDPRLPTISSLGKNTTIAIKVANVTDLYAYDLQVGYDNAILEVLSITEKGPGQVCPPQVANYTFSDNSVSGAVDVTVAFVEAYGAEAFNGSGTLLWITFNGTAEGLSIVDIIEAETTLVNSLAMELPMDPPVDGLVTVGQPVRPTGVGGVWVPVDKFALLAPYIALVSTILVATAATAIYVKHRTKRR